MPWRPIQHLDAPVNYNWSDEDVLDEKNDSWMAGLIIGMFISFVIFTLMC